MLSRTSSGSYWLPLWQWKTLRYILLLYLKAFVNHLLHFCSELVLRSITCILNLSLITFNQLTKKPFEYLNLSKESIFVNVLKSSEVFKNFKSKFYWIESTFAFYFFICDSTDLKLIAQMNYFNSFINGRKLKFPLPICMILHFILFLVTKDVSLQMIECFFFSMLTLLLSPVPF